MTRLARMHILLVTILLGGVWLAQNPLAPSTARASGQLSSNAVFIDTLPGGGLVEILVPLTLLSGLGLLDYPLLTLNDTSNDVLESNTANKLQSTALQVAPTLLVRVGHTYYVATTGSDANPGTETQPFRTLSRGVSVLTPGATLYVTSGTYTESLINNIPGGTSWGTPVTVAAYPGQTVTIRPAVGAQYALRLQGAALAYIIIDGFIIDGSNLSDDPIWLGSGPGTAETAAHHIRIQNCEIKNSPGNGIFVKWAYANEFINLNVHHNGLTSLDHGIYIKSSRNLIKRSRVYNNAGYGIHLYNDLGGVDDNIVRGNEVYGNGERGILLGSGDGNLAYNNIVWGNLRGGITINYGAVATNTAVYNNTLYANGQLGIYVGSASVGAVILNNILYQNGSGVIDAGAGTVSNHNLVNIDLKYITGWI